MADSKISARTPLGARPASGDLFVVVDVSDTTQAASGTTKKVSMSEIGGKVVGYKIVKDTTEVTSSNDNIPLDNTIPQDSEGGAYGSQIYTPTASGNTLVVRVSGMFNTSPASTFTTALFVNGTTDAIGTNVTYNHTSTANCMFDCRAVYTTTGTSSQTWTLRYGASVTGKTFYINRSSGGSIYSTSLYVTWEFIEFAA